MGFGNFHLLARMQQLPAGHHHAVTVLQAGADDHLVGQVTANLHRVQLHDVTLGEAPHRRLAFGFGQR